MADRKSTRAWVSTEQLAGLFAAWRADIDSEPYPEMSEVLAAMSGGAA